MRTPWRHVYAAAAGLALLGACGAVAHSGTVGPVEHSVFRAVNDLPNWLYRPMWVFQKFGDLFLALAIGVGVALLAHRRWVALAILGAAALKLAGERVVKQAVQRARPAVTIGSVHLRGDVPAHGLSFVSGHAVIITAVATLLTPVLPRRWKVLPWAVVVLNGVARVYVGAHAPLDILGGIGLGLFIGGVLNLGLAAVPTRRHRTETQAAVPEERAGRLAPPLSGSNREPSFPRQAAVGHVPFANVGDGSEGSRPRDNANDGTSARNAPLPELARAEGSLVPAEVVLLLVGLAIALLSGLPVSEKAVPGWEQAVFRAVNDLPSLLYWPVWAVMQFGNFFAIVALAAIALAARRLRLAIGLGIAGASVYLLAELMKVLVDRGRPAELLSGVHVRGAPAIGNGYPSGHAAVAFALAMIAWLWFAPRVRWTFLAAAVVVCFARIYVGAHFPLDVVGGAAIGVASGALVGLLLRVRHHGDRHRHMADERRRFLAARSSRNSAVPDIAHLPGLVDGAGTNNR